MLNKNIEPLEKVSVLLVDDDAGLCNALSEYLSEFFDVAIALNGREAIAKIHDKKMRFDVALVDMSLENGPNGIDVMKEIRVVHPNMEVIIFTGWGSEQRQQALQSGAFRFIEKPIHFDNLELMLTIRSAAQQVRLRKISHEMLATQELGDLQKIIIDAARSLVFADDAAVVIIDPLSGRLEIKKSQLAMSAGACFGRHLEDAGLTKEIIRRGEVFSVPEIGAEKRLDPCLKNSGFNAFIGLPIPGEKGCQGVLYAYSRNERHFDDLGHTALLRTIAAQAGLALTNAWAETRLKIHGENMDALVRTGREMASSHSKEVLYHHAWTFVQERLGLGLFFIADYDSATDELSFPIYIDDGNLTQNSSRILNDRSNWGPTGWVAKTGEEMYYPTHAKGLALCKEKDISLFVTNKPGECCFFYPIHIGDKVVGVISVQSPRPYGLSLLTLDALRALGNQVATALENIQHHEVEQRQSREAEALRQATLAVTSNIEPKKVIEKVLNSLQTVVPFDYASVQLLRIENEEEYFELIDGQGFPNLAEILNKRYEIHQRMTYYKVYQDRDWVIIDDIRSLGDDSPSLPDTPRDIRGWMGVPLVVNNKMIGLVTLNSRKAGFYTEHHAHLAETLAASVAQALDNANQHEAIQHANKTLKAMTDALSLLRSEKEPGKLLHETVHLAADLLKFKYGALFFYNEQLEEIELSAVFNLPLKLLGTRISAADSLAGVCAQENEVKKLFTNYHASFPNDRIFADTKILTCAAIPIKHPSQTEMKRVLVIADEFHREIRDNDLEILENFAGQAAAAIRTSQLITDENRRYEQLNILQEVNKNIQNRRDLDDILHIIMTGVTAGYGLGFNRAALLMLDRDHNGMRGRIAIGCMDNDSAQVDWKDSHRSRLDDFKNYLEALEEGLIKPTPLQQAIKDKLFTAPPDQLTHFLDRLRKDKYVEVSPDEASYFTDFYEAFQPTSPILIVPLISREEVIGLMVADNKFNQAPITFWDRGGLLTFANTASVAIENDYLFKTLGNTVETLEKTRKAASDITQVSIIGNLNQTLVSIRDAARQVLKCDMFTLYIYDPNREKFIGREHYGCLNTKHIRPPERLKKSSSPFKVIGFTDPLYYCTEDSPSNSLFKGTFADDEQIKATLAIKLVYKNAPVGALFINYRVAHHFTKDEINTAMLFADQAAIAIQNAWLIDQHQAQAAHLTSLYEAGKVITASLSLKDTLAKLAEQARILTGISKKEDRFCNVLLAKDNHLHFEASSPEGHLEVKIDLNAPKHGVTGRAFLTKESQRVDDVKTDPDYFTFKANTKSELAVPIIIGSQAIGVVNVESKSPAAFTEEDCRNLELLAAQAAIAIQNARAYAELQEKEGMLSAQNWLVYMGLGTSQWRHTIGTNAQTIIEQVDFIKLTFDKLGLNNDQAKKLKERIKMIDACAQRMKIKPITPPLSSEESVEPIQVAQLVKERSSQLTDRYATVVNFLPPSLEMDNEITVWASPEWLLRVVEIFVDNAVKAVAEQPVKEIQIGARLYNPQTVEVFVRDTGPGIREELRDKIGKENVSKVSGQNGMGMGLVLAHLIAKAYGGKIDISYTGKDGTEMVIRLPKFVRAEKGGD